VQLIQPTLDRHRALRAGVDGGQAGDGLKLQIVRRLQALQSGITGQRIEAHSVLNAREESDLAVPLARHHPEQPRERAAGTLGHHLFEDFAHRCSRNAGQLTTPCKNLEALQVSTERSLAVFNNCGPKHVKSA
jgi:hypothetical protein